MGLDHLTFDENVSDIRFIAWDTETTGPSPSNDHLVEIAAIAFDEDFEHRRFEMLVKPPVAIPSEATKIHGITDEMVEPAPLAGVALERFTEFLGWCGSPRVLLAHNAGFDIGVLHGEAKRLGTKALSTLASESVPEIVLDTCMLAKALLPDLPQHRLETLATHFNAVPDCYHRALQDVKALYGVFMGLLGLAADRCASAGGGLSLNALIDLCGGYFLLDPRQSETRRRPFRLPPRIAAIEPLCGTESRVGIMYETESDYRYITPLAVKIRAFKVYIEALCLRDGVKKTFRADKILRIGRVDS